MFDNDEVEKIALDLYLQFNPQTPMPDDFGFPAGPAPTHIDDVFDGGRWRKLAKHVLANYGKAV